MASSVCEENIQEAQSISFILSQKGKPLLVLNKHLFKLNKSTDSKQYWICTIKGCPAKVHTKNSNVFDKMIDDHNHLAEQENIEIRIFREKIKQRAIEETTPIPRIYDEECAKALFSNEIIAILPSEREISKMLFLRVLLRKIFFLILKDSGINKARRGVTPTIPTTQFFEIPISYTQTLREKDFLVVDKMVSRRQRLILFASPEQLKLLFTAETILMDGTFSSCPNMFAQVYTIHSVKYEQGSQIILV